MGTQRTAVQTTHTPLTVGELAARAGVAVSALHFYERKGLIVSFRTSGNQRRYPRPMLRRVSVIKAAQALGLSLDVIGDALSVLPMERAPTTSDWEKMAARWRAELDDRIARLLLLRELLSGCIGCGCLSTETCPLRNAGDRLGTRGAGPQYLNPETRRDQVDTIMAAINRAVAEGASSELAERGEGVEEPVRDPGEIAGEKQQSHHHQ